MPARTLSQLQSDLGDLIGDPSHQEWSTSQLTDKLNEAQEQFVADTQAFERRIISNVVAGTRSYSIGYAGVANVRRVVFNGYDLMKTSEAQLSQEVGQDWSNRTGTPTHWYVKNQNNTQTLALFPIPQSPDAGTGNLEVVVVQIPTSMAASSDYPFTYDGSNNPLFDVYHKALVYHAAEALLIIRPTQERLVTARGFRVKYTEQVEQCIDTLRNMNRVLRMRGGRYY